MNRDLDTLQAWATDMAGTDPDTAARPLWAQIAYEVGTYLADDLPAPDGGPSLFDGAT